ncbi:MAG: hypothetical protein ACO29V_07665 [Limnohabitans sp.]
MTPSFWTALASYCQELAPVAGPLLSAVGDTAEAVDRAGRSSSALRASSRPLSTELLDTAE